MACNEKIKTRCKKTPASCVEYATTLPICSQLEDCVTIEETTEELYNLVCGIKEEINLTELVGECLTLPSNLTVKDMFQFLITSICNLQTQIDTQAELITTLEEQVTDIQSNPCP